MTRLCERVLKLLGVEMSRPTIEELADIRSRIATSYIRACAENDYDKQARIRIMLQLVDEEIERCRMRMDFRRNLHVHISHK